MITIRVAQGDIAGFARKAIIVNLFEGVTTPGGGTGAVDAALEGGISRLISDGDCTGKYGEITVLHTLGRLNAPRVVILGLGKANEFNYHKVRDLTAQVLRHLRGLGIDEAATITHGAGIGGLDPEACAQAMAEGAVMGLYRFDRHRSKDTGIVEFQQLAIVEQDRDRADDLRRGVERGMVLAEAVNVARDMANEPANYLTPTELARRALQMAEELGLTCQIFEREDMVRMGMGGVLGVAAGSHQPPKFIVLRYRGNPTTEAGIGLVGKGITFDTGGISIKPAENMHEMKGDMTGAATVIAAITAIAKIKPRVNVVAIAPTTENMPGGSATKPGDVLKIMNGKTIEVINTDAEGRLVLADGLSYARSLNLDPIVDVATLTGAVSVALGNVAMGVMGTDNALIARIRAAAQLAGEKIWQLPLFDEYKEQIKSDVADMKNTGGRPAGAITAAALLAEFAEGASWAHLDIAGVDTADKDKGVFVKGASGIPVRTLIHLVLMLAEEGIGAPK